MSIHTYARDGDTDGVRAELASGVAVDIRDENDFTPLAYAASNPSVTVELLSLLCEAGADVDASVGKGKTFPLSLAACSGNLQATRFLLDAGAAVNAKSAKGYTALIHSIYSLHDSDMLLPVIGELVSRGADVDCGTEYGELPVTVSVRLNRFDAVRRLLDVGANNEPLKWSELAETVAVGSVEEVAHVLQLNGLDNTAGCFGLTPGLLVATIGSVAKGQLLLSHGWDVNEQGRHKETALMCCASANHPEMMAWLLDNGADTEIVDDSKNTALILAAQAGASECVRLLLNAGANPNSSNDYADTAIEVASTPETVRQLQRAGEDLGKIGTEMKRTLVGLSHITSLDCSRREYHDGKKRRFGNSNPQRMDFAFWRAMIRAGCSAYQARAESHDTDALDDPVWCFSRFGCSFTELPDGRFVQIGGEHEDYYDPDFCIYNDVIVHTAPGEFSIYGYPDGVFRPTDFHTATYVDGDLYVVGCLGYHGKREFGVTPVYRLSCTDWSIELVETTGDNPGWIFKHSSRLTEPYALRVSGGKIAFENDGEEVHDDLKEDYLLNLHTMTWQRIT